MTRSAATRCCSSTMHYICHLFLSGRCNCSRPAHAQMPPRLEPQLTSRNCHDGPNSSKLIEINVGMAGELDLLESCWIDWVLNRMELDRVGFDRVDSGGVGLDRVGSSWMLKCLASSNRSRWIVRDELEVEIMDPGWIGSDRAGAGLSRIGLS